MDIPCVMCGTPFTAKRASARYCGERCKKRAQRNPGRPDTGTVRPASGTLAPVAQIGSVSAPALGRVAMLTQKTLEDAGRVDTVMGAVALALAAKVDDPGMDTGSSIAALARQLEASLDKALDGAVTVQTPLERIKAQRERRVS